MKFLPDLIINGGLTALSLELFSQYGDSLAGLFNLVTNALAVVA